MASLSKGNRRAVLMLSVLAAVCVSVLLFRNALSSGDGRADEVVADVAESGGRAADGELGEFDPNDVDSLTLLRYGLGVIQVRSLLNYRRKGGRFDEPMAVSMLYNWTDEDLEKVLPYMVVKEENKPTYHYREQYERRRRQEYEHKRRAYEYRDGHSEDVGRKGDGEERRERLSNKFTSLTKVDLNSADTALLRRIPGVGAGIANTIVNLRSKLGGFYSVEQLSDIDFISPELYEWFEVKAADLKKINVNKASFQTLNAHPYIKYEQVKDLMNYRRMYGTIKDLHDLRGTNIFTAEELEKLEAYLEY